MAAPRPLGGEQQPGLKWVPAAEDLEVQRQQQRHPEQGGAQHEVDRSAGGEAAAAEQP
jgi:hypothetical protein